MLLFNGTSFCLKVCLTLCVINSGFALRQDSSKSYGQLLHHINGLLDILSCELKLNANAKFALLLGEFLIKQKMRHVEPTRYENQVYYHLLHRTGNIRRKAQDSDISGLQKEILDNAFQRNVLLLPPSLKYGALNANAEYEKLAINYESFVNEGMPNRTVSDQCMRDIVAMPNCKLNLGCMDLLTTEAPTYGYQRTHQLILLYMLEHNECAPHLGPLQLYELLAKTFCNEVLREQNAIRSLGLPLKYRDLYLEQATICGLFGYNEFLNWHNVVEVSSWFDEARTSQISNRHLNDLALVFYINALLLLD
ncbi:UPF0764 protein C16orf89 [Scaptodrosophila lebanonensis]|uniref:UPF0764 protein C16orf89 n=1 Tax=Drosophila lebanonensis TaxID=7225 RepID=A0A6J2TYR4_DROLE|nr:UPF0764 protein C16orf89 [Scaptodrosophila lebanonensis]